MELGLFLQYGPALLSGFGMTVLCWIIGTIGGVALGFLIALLQRYGNRPLRAVLQAYIEVIREPRFSFSFSCSTMAALIWGFVLAAWRRG